MAPKSPTAASGKPLCAIPKDDTTDRNRTETKGQNADPSQNQKSNFFANVLRHFH
ncbi:MAG: hypothetical protein ABIK31_07635 [candidate division WOR-3 bacterium]